MMKNKITVQSIKTSVLSTGDDLNIFLKNHLQGYLHEGCVVAITSKIISLAEGCIADKRGRTKHDLVKAEADVYLGEGGYGIELTVKHGLLIPSAGIDESNSQTGNYILYPKNPYQSAERIGNFLRTEFAIKDLGIILTDSHTMPLRRGVTGISLAHWGIQATKSLIGASDIFGRQLKFTSVDIVDSLAAMAVFAMGEANEQCPLAVISGAAVEFSDKTTQDEITISLENDLYYPILKDHIRKK